MASIPAKRRAAGPAPARATPARSRGKRPARARVVKTRAKVEPEHLGWGDFIRGGGEVIAKIAREEFTINVGTSAATPQMRLRAAAKCPNRVARVREEHILLFDRFKAKRHQVRALIAMGLPFVIRSGKSRVLADRHPDFERDLIEEEKADQKSLTDGLVYAIIKLATAMAAKPRRKAKAKPGVLPVTQDAQPKQPYAELRRLVEQVRAFMPDELYARIIRFLDERGSDMQIANVNKKTSDDLDRYEVE